MSKRSMFWNNQVRLVIFMTCIHYFGTTTAVVRELAGLEYFYSRYNNISTHEVDLIFILDRSASISRSEWQTMINFLRSLLEHFAVDNRNTRVAVVTYSTDPTVDINDLGETKENKCSLMSRIQKNLVNKPLKGYTATYDALVSARNLLYDSRQSAKKAVFVLTDGKSNIGPPPVRASVEMRSLLWSQDWDEAVNGPQIEVFALGIHNADISELDSIASPLPNHTYHIPNFIAFRQLARSLHRDQQSETWLALLKKESCQPSCSEHGKCMCGTKSGEYQCICQAGYEGDGHVCTECPIGYYKEGVDQGRCKRCPAHSTTVSSATTHQDQCQCETGYDKEDEADSCIIKTCPELPEIDDGIKFHVTGRMSDEERKGHERCLNTPNSSCHYQCNHGYRLTGHPALVCEANGTWSGHIPTCQIVDCNTLDSHGQAVEHGTVRYANNLTTYGSTARVECYHGYRLYGDTLRTCTVHGMWSDTRAWCIEIKCNGLSPLKNGQVVPSSCVRKLQNLGQECESRCKAGYEIQGPKRVTCLDTSQWSETRTTECVDKEPPTITCPDDLVVPVTQDNFTFVHWRDQMPRASDNTGQVTVRTTSLIENPARMVVGFHQIEFVAEDRAGNQAFCTMRIQVMDRTIQNTFCPNDILLNDVIGYESTVSWQPPVFVDNNNQTVEHQCSRQSGSLFSIGRNTVYCTPVTQLNSVLCSFSVELNRRTCDVPPPPRHGSLTCTSSAGWLRQCTVMCNNGYDFFSFPQKFYKCGLDGQWILRDGVFWPDCSGRHFSGNAYMQGDYEYFYYDGECEDIKSEIVRMFHAFVQINSWSECGDNTCSIGEVTVTCGENDRKKRAADSDNLKSTTNSKYNTDTSTQSMVTDTNTTMNSNISETETTVMPFSQHTIKTKKYVAVHFGVNVSAPVIRKITPRLLRRTLILLQNKITTGIQKEHIEFNDGKYHIFQDQCADGLVSKVPRYSLPICVACPVGTYHLKSKDTCMPCPVGTYQCQEGKTECTRCPYGMSTAESRASLATQCRRRCMTGYSSLTGLEPCNPCDKGFYQGLTGQTTCQRCPGNTSTVTTGSRTAQQCQEGCKAGTFNSLSGLEPCELCPIGTFQPDTGMMKCISCPDQLTTATRGATHFDDCQSIDFCANSTHDICGSGGKCVSLKYGYACQCYHGFTGANCDVEADDCANNPCFQNATCLDLENDFLCICPPRTTGRHCEILQSPCEDDPCLNGGSCVETDEARYSCFCPFMYEGLHCEKYNACASQPCYHGNCQNMDGNHFSCSCNPGYWGRNCEFTDFCQLKPCLNGGKCTSYEYGFSCSCPPSSTGRMCENVVIDKCSTLQCGNHGDCFIQNNKQGCKCHPGYGGMSCEKVVSPDFDLVFENPSTSDYVMLHPMTSDLSAVTICFWMRSSDNKNYGTPFSYAAVNRTLQREESNMLTLTDYGQLTLFVHGEIVTTTISVNDGSWHHICVTWTSVGGSWEIYINGSAAERGDNLASNIIIPNDGYFVIGQEQDVVGDSFSSRESFIGELSQMNMYDHVLSEHDISKLADQNICIKNYGNLLAWTDVLSEINGHVSVRRASHCLDVNECLYEDLHDCLNHRKCKDLIGGYQCYDCIYGYQGNSCDQPVDECSQNVCYNDAVCVDGPLPYDFYCNCSQGFTGSLCEVEIDFCASSPCGNHGTCMSLTSGYYCICPPYHSGSNCQYGHTTRRLPCQSTSCLNNGTCISGECKCPQGFRGYSCEVRISCCHHNPCRNEGICRDIGRGNYECHCNSLWKGRHCDIKYVPDCSLSPCLNGGSCVDLPNSAEGYKCRCHQTPGILWGPNCERNLCESIPCLHGGTCVNLDDHSYQCLCTDNYTGGNCDVNLLTSAPVTEPLTTSLNIINTERHELESTTEPTKELGLCDKLYCEHGGTCQPISEDRAWCICPVDFSGQDCSHYRERVTSKYKVSLVLKKKYERFFERGRLFRRNISEKIKALYTGLLSGEKIQVVNLHFRPGDVDGEMAISFALIYTKYLDSATPALTSKQIQQVIQDTIKKGYLGNMSVSKAKFSFTSIANKLTAPKKDEPKGAESTVSYLIAGVVILVLSLGVVMAVLCVKMRRFRYSYRKTSRMLQHLNNSNDMGLNLITNPVFDGITERIPSHGEETSCSNMYAELGDMLDPYCVTSKSDLRQEGMLRRSSSNYSSKRSNKECNLARDMVRSRKNSELSDSLSDCSKKLNSPLEIAFPDFGSQNFSNKNEFKEGTKKETKELLPAFGKLQKKDNLSLAMENKAEAFYMNEASNLSPASTHSFSLNETIREDAIDPPPSYANVVEDDQASVISERPKCETPNICVLQASNDSHFLYDIPNTNVESVDACLNEEKLMISTVDVSTFIYSSPIPEDPDKFIYSSPLPTGNDTNTPDNSGEKFNFCSKDVSNYDSKKKDCPNVTYDYSSLRKKKSSISIQRKDSASQTDYVDMNNSIVLDKVVHWKRRKPQELPQRATPPDLPERDIRPCRIEDEEDNYVEPNHAVVKPKKSGTKVTRKESASQTDYIDMEKGSMIKKFRRNSEKVKSSVQDDGQVRRKSMDDYLEILPDKPKEHESSTLPRARGRRDMSQRKLPPLPNDSTI